MTRGQKPSALPTVASLLALGGAVAAVVIALRSGLDDPEPRRITPSMILNDSITGAKIDESTLQVVPRARRSAHAARAADALRLRGKPPRAFAPAERIRSTGGLRRLAVGEDAVVLRAPPFTIRAQCGDGDRENETRLELFARSRLADSVVSYGGQALEPFGPEQDRLFATIETGQAAWVSGNPVGLTAPEGPSLAGLVSVGVNRFGSDCAMSMFAVG